MKKMLLFLLMSMFVFFFLMHPKEAFEASQNGLLLWFHQILPTLFPFSVLSGVLLSSALLWESRFFRENSGYFVILCGFLFGFPIGSKLSADLCTSGKITSKEGALLAGFTNNFGPFFVSSYVLHNQLNYPHLTGIYFGILYGIPLLFGGIPYLLYHHKEKKSHTHHIKKASRFQLNIQIIDASMISSFETLIKLCGYIILFSILVQMIQCIMLPSAFLETLIIGICEVTNGIQILALSSLPMEMKFLLSIFFLGFGGLSGIMQTSSVLNGSGISVKHYIAIKLLLLLLQILAGLIYLYCSPVSLSITTLE